MRKNKTVDEKIEQVINNIDDTRCLCICLSNSSFDGLDITYEGSPYRSFANILYNILSELINIQQQLYDEKKENKSNDK